MPKEIRSIMHNPELIPKFSLKTINDTMLSYEKYKEIHKYDDLNNQEKKLLRLMVHSSMLGVYLTQINESYSIFKERLLFLLAMAIIETFIFQQKSFIWAVISAIPATLVVGCAVIVAKSIDYIKAFEILKVSTKRNFLSLIEKYKPKENGLSEKDKEESEEKYNKYLSSQIEEWKCQVTVDEMEYNERLNEVRPHSWAEATVYVISNIMASTNHLGCKKPTKEEKEKWKKELDEFALLEKDDILLKEFTKEDKHTTHLLKVRAEKQSREGLADTLSNKQPIRLEKNGVLPKEFNSTYVSRLSEQRGKKKVIGGYHMS